MFKLVALILGLAIGFGGGVYWAHHNPDQAAKLSAEEEKRFLEAQLALTAKIKAKLDELGATAASKLPGGGSGFVSASQSEAAVADDVKELKDDAQRQEEELRKRLDALK